MDRITSIGFVVRCRDGRFLLGKSDKHVLSDNCWTVFKGQSENGETFIETAIRELKEETGIDVASDIRLNKNMSTNWIYKYTLRNKDVYLYLLNDVEGVLDNFQFVCNSFYGDGHPEISEYKKFELSEMKANLFYSQLGLVETLEKMFAK